MSNRKMAPQYQIFNQNPADANLWYSIDGLLIVASCDSAEFMFRANCIADVAKQIVDGFSRGVRCWKRPYTDYGRLKTMTLIAFPQSLSPLTIFK
jgi:hypothetical protein